MLTLLLALATLAPAEANAQAIALIKARQPAQALTVITPVVAELDRQVADARSRGLAFCGPLVTEALLYAGVGVREKKRAEIIGRELCEAQYLQAYVYTDLGAKADAVAALEKLTTLAPMNSGYFAELGFAYRAVGETAKSTAAYRKAIEFAGIVPPDAKELEGRNRAKGLRGLGALAIDAGRLDEAEQLYRQSLDADATSEVARSQLKYIAEQRAKRTNG